MRVPYRWLILAAVLAASLAAGLAEAQGPEWRDRFRAHDHNGDGRIDRAEFQEWMADVFFQQDQGRKGYLTVEDVRGAMTPEVFKALNRKQDGKLALAEFLNAMFQDFQAIDTRQEGSITIEQIDAYVRRSPR